MTSRVDLGGRASSREVVGSVKRTESTGVRVSEGTESGSESETKREDM